MNKQKKKRQEEIQQIRHRKSDFWGGWMKRSQESVKRNRKNVLVRTAKSWTLRGNHFRKGSIIDNVKENENGENSTRLGKVIINWPGLKE